MSKLTLGKILAIIGVISSYLLTLKFIIGNVSAGQYVSESVLSQVPDKINLIIAVAGGGGISAILILLIILFWDKIENFDLVNLVDYFPEIWDEIVEKWEDTRDYISDVWDSIW